MISIRDLSFPYLFIQKLCKKSLFEKNQKTIKPILVRAIEVTGSR
jgi:hypothetical protein